MTSLASCLAKVTEVRNWHRELESYLEISKTHFDLKFRRSPASHRLHSKMIFSKLTKTKSDTVCASRESCLK